MDKVLITGGLGFIGKKLALELQNQNKKVTIFDNSSRKNFNDLKISKKIKVINGDIRNKSDLIKATKNIDTVFHLAFINGTKFFYSKPKLVLEVGLKGTLNLLDVVQKSKTVKKIILASSSEIYQNAQKIPTPEEIEGIVPDVKNPRYSYGSAKLISEILLLHYLNRKKIKRIIFRPHNVYGPGMGFEHVVPEIIKKIFLASNKFKKKETSIVINGTGSETRSFCYIDDAVRSIILLAKKGRDKSIYNVGNNDETKILDIIKKISTILNISVKIIKSKSLLGSAKRRNPDIKKILNLGYVKEFELNEGLIQTVKWYKNFFLNNR